MNEDNIQLPDFLIADLYKHSIVLAGDEPKTERKQPKKDVPAAERQWYLGSNLQKITLLVSEKEAVYLQDDSLQFLSPYTRRLQIEPWRCGDRKPPQRPG
jgi:hypothetical protein